MSGFIKPLQTNLISQLKIYHPYGQVGSLSQNNPAELVTFGLTPNPEQLLKIASKIKTFTEGTDPKSSEILQIRQDMDAADRLIFVGFAFHKRNMQLITPNDSNPKSTIDCFATTFGISNSDQEVISQQISSLYKRKVNIRMSNTTCATFFSDFWRSLSF